MGKWSDKYFNRETLPENCILFAGTTKDNLKSNILSKYQTVIELQHYLFEAYECSFDNQQTLIIFQLFSAVMIADLLHYLHDGKVKNVIFIGAAYSFSNQFSIGSVVIPDHVKSMDGVVDYIEHVTEVQPAVESFTFITGLLSKHSIEYVYGKTISVPSVFVKPKHMVIADDIISMEMECASLYYYSAKLGINSVAIQVISDRKDHQLYDDQNARYETIEKIAKILLNEKRLV